jgi:DNA/RNA endonuclease YhcR with UshA esterase domain
MAKDTAQFKDGNPAVYFRDKYICVTGMVKMYNGKPEIILQSPDQIRLP